MASDFAHYFTALTKKVKVLVCIDCGERVGNVHLKVSHPLCKAAQIEHYPNITFVDDAEVWAGIKLRLTSDTLHMLKEIEVDEH